MAAQPRAFEWLTDWDRNIAGSRQTGYMEQELRRIEPFTEVKIAPGKSIQFTHYPEIVVDPSARIDLREHPQQAAGTTEPPPEG